MPLYVTDVSPRVEVADAWVVRIAPGVVRVQGQRVRIEQTVLLPIAPSTTLSIKDERHDSLPPFNDKAAPWTKGARLQKLITFETTAPDMLVAGSLVAKSGEGDARKYAEGKDFGLETRWATIGRLTGEIAETTPVWLDYTCGLHRIDSLSVTSRGIVKVHPGQPHNATPLPPEIPKDETRIANIWVPGGLGRLAQESIYPIDEPVYVPPARASSPSAAALLPKTWAKLQSGGSLHVLAWGDSVTDGGQASDDAHRYQSRFVSLLKSRFPKADVQLTTAAWGGRNTDSFLKEPPGSPHNFEKAVIEPKPDLIVMEFVNDAWMSPAVVEEKYSYLLKRFQEIGAEWIILTPHYVRPDWMNAPSVRVESDPRPYVAGLREFAAKHHVALADASLRWGHLVKEGIPYITLLSNSINHPDDRGHEIFAQSLMDMFH
jgi:lysophospholipase L1-like esterase